MTDTRPVSSGELMQILKRESMLWRLRINTDDDLWSLARLARKGMSLAMLGERRDQTTGGEEGGRATISAFFGCLSSNGAAKE